MMPSLAAFGSPPVTATPTGAQITPGTCHGARRRRLLSLALVALLPAAAPAATAWERLAELDFRGLDAALSPSLATAPPGDRLAWAVARLNRQPRSEAQVEGSAAALRVLRDTLPGEDTGLWATFFLGRIEELHRTVPRPAAAADYYRELLRACPSHPAARRARCKLAVLLVYEPTVEPSRDSGFAAAEELVREEPDSLTRAELHLMLGRAVLFFRGSPERARMHLEAALDAGIVNPTLRASSLITSAEIAERMGRPDLALHRYRQFIAENRRDARRNFAQERVRSLVNPGVSAGKKDGP